MTSHPSPSAPGLRERLRGLVGLALALAVSACGGNTSSSPEQSPPETVEVVLVASGPLRNVAHIPGQLASGASVIVKPEIEGVIESIEFAEGGEVESGTVLFRLRSEEQHARVREAKAQLALSEEVYRRTVNLAKRNISSAAQLDNAAAERLVARARLEVAGVDLARTEIRAPFDGVLGALHVAPGDRVEKKTELVRIDFMDRLQLLFNLPEIAVGIVRVGAPVSVSVAPYPDERFPGKIYFVSPTLDARSRRLLVKAWVPNPDRRLRPGLFAEIEAEIEYLEDALLVPEAAVVVDLEGTFVWRVGDGDRVERVAVETGLHQAGRVHVVSGLVVGDYVVSAGTHKLSEGSRIQRATSSEEMQAREGVELDGTDS